MTIIFLPISTVASVLGMNTNDIRTMDKSQWVFWAVAFPLTALVIGVSLFTAGILTWPVNLQFKLSLRRKKTRADVFQETVV